MPGRRIRRRHHIRCRACVGRAPGLLHRLAADVTDAGHRGFPRGDRGHPDLPGERRLRRMGLADSVPHLFPAGDDGHLHPAATGGDADLSGNEGQGRHGTQPVERSILELQHQIHPGRHRGVDRAGRRVVQRPILGPLFLTNGEEARRADLQLHCRRGVAHRDADVDFVRMALRHHRPEAGHSGGNGAGLPDVLPALCVAGSGHQSRRRQLSGRHLHHLHPGVLRGHGVRPGRGVPG